MRAFNALQIVVGFMVWPWLLQWLGAEPQPFRGAWVLWVVALAVYLVAFVATVIAWTRLLYYLEPPKRYE